MTPRVCNVVSRQVHLELGVAVTATLEAKSLPVVVTFGDGNIIGEDVSPDVTSRVRDAVDAQEATVAVVSVEAEVIQALASRVERDERVEANVGIGATACVLVGEALK